MDVGQDVEDKNPKRVQVYQIQRTQNQNEDEFLQPVGRARGSRKRLWLFVFPLIAWIACLGLAAYSVMPLIVEPAPVEIPVTGADNTETPAGPELETLPKVEGTPSAGALFIDEARLRLETCSESFRNYFILEELAIENPGIFQSKQWRADVIDAMHVFQADCEPLGTLPEAPPAYAEVEHWLKMAAGEVAPAADSFSRAVEKEEVGQFQISIRHMMLFVDYIHNAQGAMDGLLERKEI